MLYLQYFTFPNEREEVRFLYPDDKDQVSSIVPKDFRVRSHKGSLYPFGILDRNRLGHVSKKLTNAVIPEGIKVIEFRAFDRCEGLSLVQLPESMEEVDSEAFVDCKNLSKIFVPASVTTIGEDAFLCSAFGTSSSAPTIYAPKASFAVDYAKRNNLPFVEV